jgi:hypothetical protein
MSFFSRKVYHHVWLFGKQIGDTFGPIHHQKVVFADDF